MKFFLSLSKYKNKGNNMNNKNKTLNFLVLYPYKACRGSVYIMNWEMERILKLLKTESEFVHFFYKSSKYNLVFLI